MPMDVSHMTIERTGRQIHIIVGSRRLVIIIDRKLSDMTGDANRQPSGRVIVAKEYIGDCQTSLLTRIICS